ncbi:excinuclease ABC, A subunit [Gordonibacter pamelaeae 7-10-1-b]|uniref:UvrABC system protein A n=1 Tax=Gordonibacter pamelaeae 7-10-1-b TaxID=657308 RepID=D6E6Z6_9ACTN|nr:excinuclease ABC, A subunit [Gordonibacter pamelaeae 7-10-1-b]
MGQNAIVIKGAREHNLKDIDLIIPRDELVVITGLSGSGKSSLAFDTMYAEGQRRYVESLSSYARMFLGQMSKPDLDSIDGLSPAVSIDQKTTSKNPRSTVGTTTEIYDYLRLLFARVGVPHCPECGRVIRKQTTDQVTDEILSLAPGAKAIVMAPVVAGRKGEFTKLFTDLQKEGFSRVRIDGEILKLEAEPLTLNKKIKHFVDVVVDRVQLKESATSRIAEAVELATKLADGRVLVQVLGDDGQPLGEAGGQSSGAKGGLGEGEHIFSLALACPEHGHSMDELQPRDFSFNAPYGACPDCLGIGSREEVDPSLVVPDPSLTLAEGAIAPFKTGNYYPQVLRAVAHHMGTDENTPWEDLPKKATDALLYGLGDQKVRVDYVTVDGRETYWYIEWEGALAAVQRRYQEAQSDNQREKLSEYFAIVPCQTCGGKRLKPEILAVTVGDKSIHDVTEMSAADSLDYFEGLAFHGAEEHIAGPIVKEIKARLRFLVDVGLDYLTLERATATLSGGEAQRIRLATQIGAGLMGVLYILDEPSIGLHQRDNERLISTLERLRDLGNTVIVVEHDEDTIRSADYVIDMGPGAGEHGGQVVAAGKPDEIVRFEGSLTADYLSGRRTIPVPEKRRKPRRGSLKLTGAAENNLKNVTLGGSLRHAHRGHGRVGKRQELARHRHAGAGPREPREPCAPPLRHVQEDHRPGQDRQGDQHRPEPHRAHAALEPRHLHRPLGRHPGAVRQHAGVEGARLRAGALLLQRERRPLRGLQGRRPDQDRDALPARHLRALRGVRRRTLQPRDAAGDVPRQEHRRGAGHDGGRRAGVLREHPRHQAQAADAARRGARLHPPGAARHHALGRRGAAREAVERAAAPPDRQDVLHPGRAHHRPSLRGRAAAFGSARAPRGCW